MSFYFKEYLIDKLDQFERNYSMTTEELINKIQKGEVTLTAELEYWIDCYRDLKGLEELD